LSAHAAKRLRRFRVASAGVRLGGLLRAAAQRWNLQRFWRGEGPEPLPAALGRRRVYILPTRAGLAFGLVLLVMLVGAINYNNSLGYLLTFLLGSVAVVGILHTYRNLLNLRVSLGPVAPVFAGAALRVPLVLDNRGGAGRLSLELGFAGRGTDRAANVETDVPPDAWHETVLPLATGLRGRHRMGRITLSTRYPLGLFRAWAYVVPDQGYLVYPRPHPQAGLPVGPSYEATLTGDRGHGSDDFAGFRGYHPGDSLRHINWKALAREQGLLTKQFGGDRASEVWLDWRALEGLDRETRLSRLTRWVLEAESAGLTYGLWLPGRRIDPDHGPGHRSRCLETLALFEAPNP